MTINGVPVSSQEIEERCAQCQSNLYLKTYLNLKSKQRIFAIYCSTCKTEPVPVKTLNERKNSKDSISILPKKSSSSFIGNKSIK